MSAYDGYQYQFLTREEATAIDVVVPMLYEWAKRVAVSAWKWVAGE